MQARIKSLVLAAVLVSAFGCGGSSNNDQGVSFSLLEFNGFDDELNCDPNIISSGTVAPLTNGINQEATGDFGSTTCVTLQNNMTTQAVRVERLFLEYFVPGADVQPPSTTAPLAGFLGPVTPAGNGIGLANNNQQAGGAAGGAGGAGGAAGGAGGAGGQGQVQGTGAIFAPNAVPGSTLPTNFNAPTSSTSEFVVIPSEIREWLALNRSLIPSRPFNMTVFVTASGVTTSGDRLESNTAPYLVVITEDNLITPNAGVEVDNAAATVDSEELEGSVS